MNRDVRLDFFRGLALYMILVDHIATSPLSKITFQVIGFSDAAELFVFVSGVAAGIIYSRILAGGGWSALLATASQRAFRIYYYYALTSIVLIIAGTTIEGSGGPDHIAYVDQDAPLAQTLLRVVFPSALTLVLPLYVILILIVVPAFFLVAQKSVPTALLVSAAIWACSGFIWSALPAIHPLWFNPFAWQFLFAIGLCLGMHHGTERSITSVTAFRWLLGIAIVIVIASFAYRLSVYVAPRIGHDLPWLHIPDQARIAMKQNLGMLRLIHFLSCAFIVAAFVPRDRPRGTIGSYIAIAGRRPLEVFCAGCLLAAAGNTITAISAPSLRDTFSGRVAIDLVLIGLLFGFSLLVRHRKPLEREQVGKGVVAAAGVATFAAMFLAAEPMPVVLLSERTGTDIVSTLALGLVAIFGATFVCYCSISNMQREKADLPNID